MNKRTGAKAAIATVGLVLAAATPALATTVNVGGGTWSYDQGANTAWSNYKHASNYHASSVSIGGQLSRSGCTSPGSWSLASGSKNGGSINYYYDPSC
ncbi:Bacteriocin [Streptomyces sp. ADI96-02]|uniref:lactococcin 972 family bacteriocin n=1 Tax=unclassified Streptomyces TaxID=2593676 RepID=UPI000F90DDA4|nr:MULTISPECIES: lactococcin 972 family bacteriocin [unclassified Streptomyces]RPK43549.1 Bacteriocin [Streptomyces sp. ADI93-02]RPK65273.1 Bacteriocin [Streptomyces sp. ADI96-02]